MKNRVLYLIAAIIEIITIEIITSVVIATMVCELLLEKQEGQKSERKQPQMSTSARESFNSQFSAYAGQNRSASQVRSLNQPVKASNALNAEHIVQMMYKENEDAIPVDMTDEILQNLRSKERYIIKIEDRLPSEEVDGYYDVIIVTKQ